MALRTSLEMSSHLGAAWERRAEPKKAKGTNKRGEQDNRCAFMMQ